jgi:hypothetical protein
MFSSVMPPLITDVGIKDDKLFVPLESAANRSLSYGKMPNLANR